MTTTTNNPTTTDDSRTTPPTVPKSEPPKGRLKFETDDVPDSPTPSPNMTVAIRTGER